MKDNINSNSIRARFEAKNGKTYIFYVNGEVYEEQENGDLIKIDISKKSEFKKIRNNLGKGMTDVSEKEM